VHVSLHFREVPADSGTKETLVLLHGLGADEQDLVGLAPYISSKIRVISIRAPRTYEFGGYSWFDTRFSESGLQVENEQAVESLAVLAEFLRSLSEQIWLGGFSQGALMTIGILLEHPDLIRGAIAMSGGWLPCFQARGNSTPPVIMTHGVHDPIVPVSFGRESAERLSASGRKVDWKTYPMAHEISLEALQDISTWLTTQVGDKNIGERLA